jgi:hypothetical protein
MDILPSPAFILLAMKAWIDDLPASESVSRLRAAGVITAETTVTTVVFGDQSFDVAVVHRRFPNGGGWSFFACPCGHRARILRLEGGSLGCKRCLEARGFRYRAAGLSGVERMARTIPRLRARLLGGPARLHPRPGRVLDRRVLLEAALRRAELNLGFHDWGRGDVDSTEGLGGL